MQILEKGTSHDLELFFVTAWSIWYNRNQVVHEAVELPSAQIWGYAQRLMSDFKGAIPATLLSQQSTEVGWAAPPPNTYKINVDGATSKNGKPSSVGVVIRDYRWSNWSFCHWRRGCVSLWIEVVKSNFRVWLYCCCPSLSFKIRLWRHWPNYTRLSCHVRFLQ